MIGCDFSSLDILFLLLAQGSILAAPRTANGLFLRAHLVGTLLIAAQIDKSVGIANDALPIVLEKSLQLADILQDDGSHHIPASHGSLQAGVTVGEGYIVG